MLDYAFYAANSGLAPAARYSYNDHYLAWLRFKTGKATGSQSDNESLLYVPNERGYYLTALGLSDTGQSLSTLKVAYFVSGGSTTPIVNSVAPAVTPTSNVAAGSPVTTTNGTWTPASGNTYSYQWYSAGVLISGATAQSYTVQTSDAGNAVTCRVTASQGGYSAATAISNAVTPPLTINTLSETWAGASGAAPSTTNWTVIEASGNGSSVLQSGSSTCVLTSPGNNAFSLVILQGLVNNTDQSLLTSFTFGGALPAGFIIGMRTDGNYGASGGNYGLPTSGYYLTLAGTANGAGHYAELVEAYSGTILWSSTTAIALSTTYGLRWELVGKSLNFRFWTGTEPGTWNYQTTTAATDTVWGSVFFDLVGSSSATSSTVTLGATTLYAPNAYTPVVTTMPTGIRTEEDGTTYSPVWANDFNTNVAVGGDFATPYGQYFTGYSAQATTGSPGTGWYRPDKVLSVANGALHWHMYYDSTQPAGQQYLCAAPVIMGYAGFLYGSMEVRVKMAHSVPSSKYKVAFLMWPDSNNWSDGEIDWLENDSLDGRIRLATVHTSTDADFLPSPKRYSLTLTDDGNYHIVRMVWAPTYIKWYVDGNLYSTVRTAAYIPTVSMHPVLQAETAIGQTPGTAETADIDVDWVVARAKQ